MVDRPSQKLEALLMGRTAWDDADAPIRSWAMFYIYEAAAELLDLPTKAERRAKLSRIPPHIRPRIEAEMIRVYNIRKGA